MEIAILIVFILGYICIAAEHAVKIDKAATALLTGTLCWTLYFIGGGNAAMLSEHVAEGGVADVYAFLDHRLMHHLQEISGILLFLMGAMTIVELIDAHEGFKVITDRITSRNKVKLMWTVALLSFFLSAALDNLTTAIVMISLTRKLIDDQQTRWFFGGIIIIAANAGGAWSPIGDVTTTMLWIGHQITAGSIVPSIFIPSMMSLLVPLVVLSFILKGEVKRPEFKEHIEHMASKRDRQLVFFLGVGGLLLVPVFKTVTHLPPFMGMMFSLGLIWMVTELIHSRKIMEERSKYSALQALRKIDMPSVLFFLGILLAVGVLNETGQLTALSAFLKDSLGNIYAINVAIGLLSAIIDNVPLVAASMGMYEVSPALVGDAWADLFVQDGAFWHFLAYTAGTGGSILIIGSAAGVAVMGIEKITFTWYLRNIAPWALLGYLAGCAVYVL
ncbi:MAG: sodium:proton antiporter NhaD [Flavobacteriales bacterium]|jgi:Na+/H+ antiporter NhaD/arsenite permease-like protein